MKSSFFKTLHVAMALILCLAAITPAALAAEPLSMSLPVRITLEGTLPDEAETFVIRMTADDASYPMPGGQTGGSVDMQIKGAKNGTFPAITYDRLGIYTYTIHQIPGSNADCTYDGRVYRLRVSVTNAEGGGHAIIIALHESGKAEKPDIVHFHNVYKTIVTPPGDVTPTGVNDRWMYYAGGCALLLIAAGFILRSLLRKEVDWNGGKQ